jgi:hypothetical protein
MTKRKAAHIVLAALSTIIVAGGLAYANRGAINDWIYERSQPDVPAPVSFDEVKQEAIDDEEGAPSEEVKQVPVIDEETADETEPNAPSVALAAEINLDVPFLLQAPNQNWVQPYADACEEASLLMVDAYYKNKGSDFTTEEGLKEILDVAAYEDTEYGHNKDTTSEEVALTAKNYFGFTEARIIDVTSAEDIKTVLAEGRPVIVPAYGKALGNPNFRNGGPDYHMLVIKGYTSDGYFITNDPGTRRGKGYVYKESVLLNAIHAFYPGDMTQGAKHMILLIP